MTTRRTKDLAPRIVADAGILAGKPVVRGTRIAVELVLQKLARDPDIQGLLRDFPALTADDVQACIAYGESLT